MTAPLDLDAPPCPECGGALVETKHRSAREYECGGCGWWDVKRDDRLTLCTAPRTTALVAEVDAARARAMAWGLTDRALETPAAMVDALGGLAEMHEADAKNLRAEVERLRDERDQTRSKIERLERMVRDQQGDLRHADRLLAEALGEHDGANARVAEERARAADLVSTAHDIISAQCPEWTVWLERAEAYLNEHGEHAEGGDRGQH